MRIIQILNSPNWSGASNYCVSLCGKLKARGHDVLLLTEPGKPRDFAQKMQICLDDGIRLNHRNPYLYLQAIKKMCRIFNSFRPEVISSHINEGAWMAGMIARRICPRTAVVRTRTDIDPPKNHFINRFVHHHWTDHLIVGSFLHKRLCRKLLDFPADAIDVVYGAIDTERFRVDADPGKKFRKEIVGDASTLLIGLLARLDPIKGHEFALKSLALLKNNPSDWKLIVLGYENQRSFAWLKNLAAELGIASRLAVFGFREDLPEVLSSLDVGLISSIGSEGNCRAALEFMTSGKPVVATTVGVIPEIIQDGEQGFLVPPKDPVAMAAALSKLLDNPFLRKKMGDDARIRMERNFNLDLFTRRTEEVYEKALRNKQAGERSAT